jgi:hypothetical protein
MAKSEANKDKARFIFEQVFQELKLNWAGPEFDVDRDSYKARIQEGDLKGRLVLLSEEKLEDHDVSAEQIRQGLVEQLKLELARKPRLIAPAGSEIGYWMCIHCGREHLVLAGGATGCVSVCPTVSAWISVLPQWVYEKARELREAPVQQN